MLNIRYAAPLALSLLLSSACADDRAGDSSETSQASGASAGATTDASGGTATVGTGASGTTTASATTGVGTEGGTTGASESGTSTGDTGETGETETTGGGICQEACDLFDQEACGEGRRCASFICTPGGDIWDNRICVASGPKLKGESCVRQDDPQVVEEACGRGLMCFGGTCIDNCIGSQNNATCPDPNEACVIANEGNLAFCTGRCDPIVGDCEVDGALCVPNEPVNNAFICVPPGPFVAGRGESCSSGADGCVNCCEAGTVCAEPGKVESEIADCNTDHCCTALCDLDGSGEECSGQEICLPVFQTEVPGYEKLGVCQIPVR